MSAVCRVLLARHTCTRHTADIPYAVCRVPRGQLVRHNLVLVVYLRLNYTLMRRDAISFTPWSALSDDERRQRKALKSQIGLGTRSRAQSRA